MLLQHCSSPKTTEGSVLNASLVEELAARIRGACGLRADQAADLEALCEAARMTVEDVQLGGARGGMEASLVADSRTDEFHARVDSTPPGGWHQVPAAERPELHRHRRRFRVCHELAHTFQFERHAGRSPRLRARNVARNEEFCDELARAILVPPSAAAAYPLSADSVFELQIRYDVSLEVAARALAAKHSHAMVAVWWWPIGHTPRSRLLAQWSSFDRELVALWRASDLVARAASEQSARGRVPVDRDRRAGLATARWRPGRRQLVAVGGPPTDETGRRGQSLPRTRS